MNGISFNKFLFVVLFCIINVNSLFFELEDHERCYLDELFADNVVMINYRFYDLDEKDPETKRILDSIIIKIINNESDNVISQHNVRRPSGKHSTTITQNSFYKICVHKVQNFQRKLRVRLIIDSDNMDEPDLSKAVKHDDVNQAQEIIQKITKKGHNIINVQKVNLEQEDESSTKHIEYSRRFIMITIVQIVLILALGIYNIFSFRNFLISKNLI